MFEIKTEQQYPLDHDPLVDQAAKEQDNQARPKLVGQYADVRVESHVLSGMPHGYGPGGGWIPDYDRWLTEIFEKI